MKLSEIKGETALDALAALLDPVAELCRDKEWLALLKTDKLAAAKNLLRDHKPQIIAIMAVLDGETPETYLTKVNLLTLPRQVLELLNDPELMLLFT